jgi:hypothetical protein
MHKLHKSSNVSAMLLAQPNAEKMWQSTSVVTTGYESTHWRLKGNCSSTTVDILGLRTHGLFSSINMFSHPKIDTVKIIAALNPKMFVKFSLSI